MASATARTARLPRRITWPRRLAVLVALSLALAAGYTFWLRDSSLVAVEQVRIEGLSSVSDPEVAGALRREALQMTTLHIEIDELAAAVRQYPTVKSLSTSPGFPSSLTISVEERVPVAVAGEIETPVAADGTLLPGVEVEAGELPAIEAAAGEGTQALDETGGEQAAVLGAAPAPLLEVVERSDYTPEGVIVELDGGISLRFGDASQAAAKWSAAARILADPGLDALDYIDLRVPDRPAVGGGLPSAAPAEVPAPG